MKIEPMEARLSREWGLKTADRIRDHIFKDYKEIDSLKDILDAKTLVVCSYALGKILASREVGLKSSQLRRFYDSLLNIRAGLNIIRTKPNSNELFKLKIMPGIIMLKPQLANAKARQQREVTPFFNVINPLIDLIKDIEDYDRLCQFAESIVAYHKYCGGRD